MPDVFNDKGEVVGDIPLSVKQLALLERGEEITVIYHTPQLLRGQLGERSGAFTLHRAQDRIVTLAPDAVKHYADLQKAIAAARGGN